MFPISDCLSELANLPISHDGPPKRGRGGRGSRGGRGASTRGGSLASPSLKKPNASERRPSARTWPSCRRIRMGTDFNLPLPRSLLASLVLKSDNAFYGVFFTWDLAQVPLPSIQWLLDACFPKDLALARSTCLTRLGKDRAEPMETSVRKGGRNCV
jgi:hypothetical protein